MKLLRCHIDNFGKLTDYTVDFTENPQVFYEPNGWGKSTLAAFIKVMFYGFAGESKRGATLEKERIRFKPWQGGAYGGELLFEIGGKQYLMNRTFGSKEAEDTFALYDGVTNLRSEDYSSNIGEELFQINQESFLRTVFLGQNDCDTATTDSINAKIGNLADNLDDINNYEKVQLVLKDLRNSMSPTRKTGSLKKQKEVIAELKDELRKAGAMESAVAELEQRLAACDEDMTRLDKERKVVRETWEVLNRKKAVEAAKTHYESIVNQCMEKQKLVDEGLGAMGGQVPEREELLQMQRQYKLLQEKESEVGANSLQESEQVELARLRERFVKGVPQAETLKTAREQAGRLEKLRLEAAKMALDESELAEKRRLEEQFAGWDGVTENAGEGLAGLEARLEEGLHHVSAYMDRKNGLSAKKATLSSLKVLEQQQIARQREQELHRIEQLKSKQEARRKAQTVAVAVLIAGAVLLVAGGILAALANQTTGIVLLCAGAVAVALSVVMIAMERKGQAALHDEISAVMGGTGFDGETADDENGWNNSWAQENSKAGDGVRNLEQEIAQDEEQMARNAEFVVAILQEIEGGSASGDYPVYEDRVWENPMRLRDKLYGWKDDVKRLRRLCAKEQDYQAKGYEAQIQRGEVLVTEVLKPYCGQVDAAHMSSLLAELFEDRESFVLLDARDKKCKSAQAEATKYRQQIADYLAEYKQGQEDLFQGLQMLAGTLNDYENDGRELDRLRAEKKDFEAANDIAAFGHDWTEVTCSEEELKERMTNLDETLSSLNEQVHAYRRQLEDKQEEQEALALQKEQLDLAEADYEKDYVYYTRIGYVSEYLEKAKESLSARYIGPVMDSFKRYYELLSGESGEDFRMDANIHVTKRDLGEQRETGAFSAGNRDLINIVLRVALVEAMYQHEKPFLIIDDSFVNLDGRRLETAGKFLKQIARDYQVIYFTCHESRVLTDSN